MTARAHGTRAKYVWDRCRCRACRLANTRYSVALDEARRPPMIVKALNGRGHDGTEFVVMHRETHFVAARGRGRDQALALRDWINAAWRPASTLWAASATLAKARRHMLDLQAAGIGLHQVARLAGMSRSHLTEILRGSRRRGGRAHAFRVKRATVDRLLAIRADDLAAAALVPAAETWRIIGEVLASGMTKQALARRLGSTAKVPALQLRRDFVLRKTAERVARLHDELWASSPALRAVCSWECLEKMGGRRKTA